MIPSILIVEDDLTFSTMLKTWLGKKGFEVETASTQAKARKQIGSREFDLILSDLRLPDQDGMSLLSWLREQHNQVPFIIMTSYAEIQSAVRAMKEGATDYISKPVQPDELLKKSRKPFTGKKLIPTPPKIRRMLLLTTFWKEKVKKPENCIITSTWWLLLKCRCSSTVPVEPEKNM